MSVALLSYGLKIVGIPDELESFLHVLLYYAVRYLKVVDCDSITIAHFLYAYFDLYGVDEGTYVCGDKKCRTVTEGRLTISERKTLEFGSPLDQLFRSRYCLFQFVVFPSPARWLWSSQVDTLGEYSTFDRGSVARLSARR